MVQIFLLLTALTLLVYQTRGFSYGEDAAPSQFPFMVFITTGAIWCTGTIIRPDVVLTAAQCVYRFVGSEHQSILHAGTHNIKKPSPRLQLRESNDYVYYTFDFEEHARNNIALIFLKEPFLINAYVRPIEFGLPPHNDLNGFYHMVIGWHKLSFINHVPDFILHYRNVFPATNCTSICQTDPAHDHTLTASGYSGTGANRGTDLGAPIIWRDARKYKHVQLGVVNHFTFLGGDECEANNCYLYADLIYHEKWIKEQLETRPQLLS